MGITQPDKDVSDTDTGSANFAQKKRVKEKLREAKKYFCVRASQAARHKNHEVAWCKVSISTKAGIECFAVTLYSFDCSALSDPFMAYRSHKFLLTGLPGIRYTTSTAETAPGWRNWKTQRT